MKKINALPNLSLVKLWLKAKESPNGLSIKSADPHYLRAKLYDARPLDMEDMVLSVLEGRVLIRHARRAVDQGHS